jgi:protein-L-isoaspartate O-methyltransferase
MEAMTIGLSTRRRCFAEEVAAVANLPRHMCHNYSIAIDADRLLFNGAPGVVAAFIDTLTLVPGERVLRVGTDSAITPPCSLTSSVQPAGTGDRGRSHAADDARDNLGAYSAVEVQHGDGTARWPSGSTRSL